jgi:hypothetical protein
MADMFEDGNFSRIPILQGRSIAHRKLTLMRIAAQTVLFERPYAPTIKQAAGNFRVAPCYVHQLLRLSPDARDAVACGENQISFVTLRRFLQELDAAWRESPGFWDEAPPYSTK